MKKAGRQLASRLEDKEWLLRAGKKARELAMSKFSRDNLARKLEMVLLESVTENKK
jgi:hypothetical protein